MKINLFWTIVILALIGIVGIIYKILENEQRKVKMKYVSIDTALIKRWNLIPKLIEISQKYNAFEQKSLEKLSYLGSQDLTKFNLEQKLEIDSKISKIINKMFEMAEEDQKINSDEDFIKIKEEFTKLEDEIKKEKSEYNNLSKAFNKKLNKIPIYLVAILFGINEEEALEKNQK